MLLFAALVACENNTLSCVQIASRLKTALDILPYQQVESLYASDACGFAMTVECMRKAKEKLMNFPLNELIDHGAISFCKALGQENLAGRTSKCNWCISAATLLKKWKVKMQKQKYEDFSSDFCYTCGRYNQRTNCEAIVTGINQNANKSAQAVCETISMCNLTHKIKK